MTIELAKQLKDKYLSSTSIYGIVGGRQALTQATVDLLPADSNEHLIQAAYLQDVVEVMNVNLRSLFNEGVGVKTLNILDDLKKSRLDGIEKIHPDTLILINTRSKALTSLLKSKMWGK